MTNFIRFFILSSLLMAAVLPATASLDKSILYLHPKPASIDIRPQSSIIVKVAPARDQQIDINTITYQIVGEKSGVHSCDVGHFGNTITFKPHRAFAASENVNVSIDWGVDVEKPTVHFSFTTSSVFELGNLDSSANEITLQKNNATTTTAKVSDEPVIINGVAVPNDFPILHPFVNESGTAPGRLFFSIMQDANPYIMILENDGTPYFYRKVERRTRDFKVQPTGHLSRMITPNNALSDGWEVLDDTFSRVGVYKARDGYLTNDHEFVMTEANTYLIIADDYRKINNRNIHGNHIQEVDLETGQVVFFWNSWDYLSREDAIHGNDANGDYIHMNSIAVDYDSNLVISCRHQDQCLKINRVTGDIMWRLGGVKNEFDFINDSHQISYQHHIQPVPGKPDHYTIFDNGNFHSPKFSRGVEFKLDTDAMTAEKVWEYRATPDRYTGWMGSTQRLPNGNTLINWADARQPKPTEVTPDGEVVYDADFTPASHVYRAFRFDWDGEMSQPYLLTEAAVDAIRLIFNKFGDEDVVAYKIYGGVSENDISLITSTTTTWYDVDMWTLPNKSDYYFKVTAVNSHGDESAASNVESTFVNYSARENSQGVLGSTAQADENDPNWYLDNWHFGNSLSFDGDDDFVDCGTDPSLHISGSTITLEARVKARGWKDNVWGGCVITKDESTSENVNEGYMIRVGNSGAVNFNIGGEGPNSSWHELNTPTNTLTWNKWHHVAATYDGATMKIYVDGVEIASRTADVTIGDAGTKPLYIGNSPQWTNRCFRGLIDEVRVWNKTRTQEEIQATMNIQLDDTILNNEHNGLVGYWRLNEGNGQTTEDLATSRNLISNGGFSENAEYWTLRLNDGAVATPSVSDDMYEIDIENGGNDYSDVILSQSNIYLEHHKKYRLEFDAWADADKIIELKLRKTTTPYTDYGRIGAVLLRATKKQFIYTFEMTEFTDNTAIIEFLAGGNDTNMYIDNISLLIDEPSQVDDRPQKAGSFTLFNNYPNPFNPTTTIHYSVGNDADVRLVIFNARGHQVRTLVNAKKPTGTHTIEWHGLNDRGEQVSSGVYFYSLRMNGHQSDMKKMLLVK